MTVYKYQDLLENDVGGVARNNIIAVALWIGQDTEWGHADPGANCLCLSWNLNIFILSDCHNDGQSCKWQYTLTLIGIHPETPVNFSVWAELLNCKITFRLSMKHGSIGLVLGFFLWQSRNSKLLNSSYCF